MDKGSENQFHKNYRESFSSIQIFYWIVNESKKEYFECYNFKSNNIFILFSQWPTFSANTANKKNKVDH